MVRLVPILLLAAAALAQPPSRIEAPGGGPAIELRIPENGPNSGWLCYAVSYRGKPAIAESRLGLKPANQPPLGSGVKLRDAAVTSIDDSYTLLVGRVRNIRFQASKLTWTVEETAGLRRILTIEAIASADGVAFRYVIPRQTRADFMLLEAELTQFTPAKEGPVWGLHLRGFNTSFEDNYTQAPLTALKENALFTLPFLTEVPGAAWVAISEAHLENWSGLYLTHGRDRTLEAKLAPRVDSPEIAVRTSLPASSPWRVLMLGDSPARLTEAHLITDLCPPSRVTDVSWIKPGKTSWSWWSGDLATGVSFTPGMNTDTMKHYIDFSAEAGLEYVVIDAGWAASAGDRASDLTRTSPAIDMPAILAYAKEKKVGVWLWAYWTDIDRQLDEAFPLFEKWDIKGVKIDFMDRDDQTMVDFYHRVAKKAGENHLMIDFHGAYKPNGMARYYPHVLTHEGVLGLEYLKWSARTTAEHDTILPFTRGLAGPMDYTPGGFRNVTPEEFAPVNRNPVVPHTRAHQMALYVLLESPLQMLADHPNAYRGQKELEFLKDGADGLG